MRCENQNETMPLNRFLAKGWVIPALLLSLDLGILLGCNYIINSLYQLKAYSQDTEHPFTYFGPQNLWFHLDQGQGVLPYLYLVILGMLLVLDACLAYQIRVSFSEKTINHGQKGTRRWTTIPEIRQQYKEIPMKDTFYPGKGCWFPGTRISYISMTFPATTCIWVSHEAGKEKCTSSLPLTFAPARNGSRIVLRLSSTIRSWSYLK